MQLAGLKIGFSFTGSFCTLRDSFISVKSLIDEGAEIFPIVSNSVKSHDTRFGKAKDFLEEIEKITGKSVIDSIVSAEPIGPKSYLDLMVIAPCTGNTLSKIANGITDTPVTMAVKAHLRNQKPVVISVATNDALGANSKNLGILLNSKNVFFVPFYQDGPHSKSNSIVANLTLVKQTVLEALKAKQLQPVVLGNG